MDDKIKTEILTTDEFRVSLQGMPDEDVLRLQKYAKNKAYGTGMNGSDLISEAICRILEESPTRNCPRSVKPIAFLHGVIKSIASDERQKWKLREPVDDTIFQNQASTLGGNDLIQSIDATKIKNHLEELFTDDPNALAYLIGLLEGWTKKETMEMGDMTEQQFEAARKRFRRRVTQSYVEGLLSDET